jgi:hypothetical protein
MLLSFSSFVVLVLSGDISMRGGVQITRARKYMSKRGVERAALTILDGVTIGQYCDTTCGIQAVLIRQVARKAAINQVCHLYHHVIYTKISSSFVGQKVGIVSTATTPC